MALVDHKSGAAAVDPDDHNAVVDAVITLQAGGGSLPAGGTTGQVLTKASNADGDADWEAGGGSQTLEQARVAFAFDDAGIAPPGTGKVIYTPAVGDVVLFATVSITAAFDGTTPSIAISPRGASVPLGDDFITNDATVADAPTLGGTFNLFGDGTVYMPVSTAIYANDTTPLVVTLTDSNDGDPESSHGAGVAVLLILKAA